MIQALDPLVVWMASIPILTGLVVSRRPRPHRMQELISIQRQALSATSTPVGLESRRKFVLWASAVALASVLAGPVAAMCGVAITLAWPRLRLFQLQRKRSTMIALRFPDFLDLLVLTIRSGCTPLQAFAILGMSVEQPIRAAVVSVGQRVRNGDRFADAVADLRICLGLIAQPLADTLAAADRHGAPIGPMLDRLADEARAQRRRNAEVAARQLPIKLSLPLVGCTLPSFVLLTIVPLMAGTLSSIKGLRL